MKKFTGNMLSDLFGFDDLSPKITQFNNFLKEKNQIPFIHFDGKNNLENELHLVRRNGKKSSFSEIYSELNYKLNRGPLFYFSECVVNYSFKTFIIFVQDGWILEDPNNEGKIVLYPWEMWKEVLFTKHKDLDAPVILLAYPTEANVYELSISPKLDMKSNVVIEKADDSIITGKYTDEMRVLMIFAYSVLKRYWCLVDKNRGESTNTIPLDTLYILNEKSMSSLDSDIATDKNKSEKKTPEKIYNAHVYAFYYIHFAKIDDNFISREELHTIADKIALWVMNDFPKDQLNAKVRTIVQESKQWYDSLDPKAREEEVVKICDWLKTQLTEFGDYHRDFLKDMVDIAKANGNFSQKEKDLICHTAKHWEIEFDIYG